MGKTYETIEESVRTFIEAQQMFFVATAPLSEQGLVNLSPKGLDSFRVLDEMTVAYLDLAGSGVETIAHIQENGRITLMFCAFEGAGRIVRLYGQGEVLKPDHKEYADHVGLFPELPGIRSVIRIKCTRIADSCGWGVPLYDYQGQRTQLTDVASKKGPKAIQEYIRVKNAQSLDGLQGV